jgi:hypothetical protein
MEIDLKEGAKQVANAAFGISPAEMNDLQRHLSLLMENGDD